MWKKHLDKMVFVVLAFAFLLIPVADVRPFKNIPVYPLDIVFLAIIFCVLWQVRAKDFLRGTAWLILGLFFLSEILSWLLNGASLTGLGQLKSWVLLPAAASFLVAWKGNKNPERDTNLLKIWLIGLSALLMILLPYYFSHTLTFDGRLQGPFTSPNFLAFFLFPGAILSFFFWQQASDQKEKKIFALLGLFFLFFLFQTHSFGGWLALTGACAWYFLRNLNFRKFLGKGVFIVLLLGVFLSIEVATSDKLAGIFEERSSLSSRMMIWRTAWQAVEDHPVFGIGMGRFQEVYLAYQPLFPPYLEWAVPQPHNLLLALWLQSGILGLFAMLVLVYQALLSKPMSIKKEPLLLQALLVGMLVYGIFDTPLFGNALALVWWFTMAFLLFPAKVSASH